MDRIQFTGDNYKEIEAFCDDYLGYICGLVPTIFSKPNYEGTEQQISKGDWIIRISDTEFKEVDRNE